MKKGKPLLVFDVESIGLHGEGFAFAYVVLDGKNGKRIEEGMYSCPVTSARPPGRSLTASDLAESAIKLGVGFREMLTDRQKDDWDWVHKNVIPHLPEKPTHADPKALRTEFWHLWRRWEKKEGATLWAEWGWPVEARFLAACVDDALDERCWNGPCPLHEIATVRRKDPQTCARLEDEKPAHHPLADARQSARLLWEALQGPKEPTPAGGCTCTFITGTDGHIPGCPSWE